MALWSLGALSSVLTTLWFTLSCRGFQDHEDVAKLLTLGNQLRAPHHCMWAFSAHGHDVQPTNLFHLARFNSENTKHCEQRCGDIIRYLNQCSPADFGVWFVWAWYTCRLWHTVNQTTAFVADAFPKMEMWQLVVRLSDNGPMHLWSALLSPVWIVSVEASLIVSTCQSNVMYLEAVG